MVSIDWHEDGLPGHDLDSLGLLGFAKQIAGGVDSLFIIYWDRNGKSCGASILMRILPSETLDALGHIQRRAHELSAGHGVMVQTGEGHRSLEMLVRNEGWWRALRLVRDECVEHVLRFAVR